MLIRRDLEALDGILREAAGAIIMPAFRRLGPAAIRAKSGPLDLVTDADESAEIFITEALKRYFPGCLVVGEEASSRDPSLLDRLVDAELAFVVDPIDGTANFAAGLPLFGTMLAATRRGDVVAAVIHDPVTKSSAMALRGEGAWEQEADGVCKNLCVAPAAALDQMIGAISWRYLPDSLRTPMLPNLASLGPVFDFRCAAHQYRLLASGQCHFMLFYKLMPWDHLPGWLLHREAGGYAAQFDGSPYAPGQISGGLLCAPDRDTWERLMAVLLAARHTSPAA